MTEIPGGFIQGPPRYPFWVRVGLWVAERRQSPDLSGPALLSWYPRALAGSAVMEALIAHHDGAMTARLLKIVRMTVSFTVDCPFCIGTNSDGWERLVSEEELAAVQGLTDVASVTTFSEQEQMAIVYARLASATPIRMPSDLGTQLNAVFTEREIVILATTTAQVNYWARTLQGLRVPSP